ncbi:MAG: hypothetical protein LBM92_05040 [Opitutaceae bacterium]|jgi:predicted nucleic-acid-binding protein|nr:hypothetical protein [Opitutaceae bacterium]
MNTIGLDTSVVLRLLTGEPAPLAQKTVARVMEIISAGGHCLVSDLVVTEAYFALQHHYKLPKSGALAALAAMSAEKGFDFSPAAAALLKTPRLDRANPGFADRLIHAEYRAAAAAMLTCEQAAAKLGNVEIVTET